MLAFDLDHSAPLASASPSPAQRLAVGLLKLSFGNSAKSALVPGPAAASSSGRLGNALNGISLGLEAVLRGLRERRFEVELLLAHGATPKQAAYYQIFILYCIASCVALGTVGVVYASLGLVFDERWRLRSERIEERG